MQAFCIITWQPPTRKLPLSATWGHDEKLCGFEPCWLLLAPSTLCWRFYGILHGIEVFFSVTDDQLFLLVMICKFWLFYSFCIRQTSTDLTSNQYEVISEETLQSLSDKFDVIAESIDCDPEYDVSYGVGFVKY